MKQPLNQSASKQPSSMEITALCAVIAALRVLPNRSQFFHYESVSLSCWQQGSSSEWRVKKNTSASTNKECSPSGSNRSVCHIDDLYPRDTGAYWCESAAGECSDAVSITVTPGPVILESPAVPVMEGDDVTLRCKSNQNSSSNQTADFFQDGRLIGSSSTGHVTIHSVSTSDDGLYKCNMSGEQSPESRLTVRETGHPHSTNSPLVHILLPVVVACLSLVLLVSVLLLCLWKNHKGKADVSYTDVIIKQEVQPNRIRDVDDTSTFYSTLKPGNT